MNTPTYDNPRAVAFHLYRFQLLVTNQTPFQDITIYPNSEPITIRTPEELAKYRLDIFREILRNFDDQNEKYHIREETCESKESDQFLFTCQKNTIVTLTENYQKKEHTHQPFVWIAVDTSEHVQTLAITGCKEIRFDTAEKKFSEMLQKKLSEKNLTLAVSAIRPPSTFWDLVSKYEDGIKAICFTVQAPNMSDLNDTFTEELREYTGDLGGQKTQITTTACGSEPLKLTRDNNKLVQLARYSDEGGGAYVITVQKQGKQTRIRPKGGKGEHSSLLACPFPPKQKELLPSDKKEGILTKLRDWCTLGKRNKQ